MAKAIFTKIDKLADELGTAEGRRKEIEQEISDLEQELVVLNEMAEDATDREEYENVITQRRETELDIRFARNRLRLFDQSPRIDPEALTDLLAQLGDEADDAAARYRQEVERPLAEIVKAGDEFDATVNAIREAVRKLASVDGPVIETDDTLRRLFGRFELGKLRSRAYADNTVIYPAFRDALKLATSAKWEPFDTH